MAVAVYNSVQQVAQSEVYGILSSDSVVKEFAGRVLDGFAAESVRRFSSFVLVHTPSVAESNLTLGRNRRVRVSLDVECISRQESIARKLSDGVRGAIEANLTALNGAMLRNKMVSSSSVAAIDVGLGDVIDVRHVIVLTIEFDFTSGGS
jgi:hypothetical protein